MQYRLFALKTGVRLEKRGLKKQDQDTITTVFEERKQLAIKKLKTVEEMIEQGGLKPAKKLLKRSTLQTFADKKTAAKKEKAKKEECSDLETDSDFESDKGSLQTDKSETVMKAAADASKVKSSKSKKKKKKGEVEDEESEVENDDHR